ncbi:transducin family protein / WD-40 repeat family protein [Zea mays]|uniref:Transducin family protein / WD-40 repeat family protein n=2 Tax=Zea mays TaxID=4577 RepID=A0A1D6L944_MAIZE|nr:transducin family protein / WD-40 repeat family protein [Zea mays]
MPSLPLALPPAPALAPLPRRQGPRLLTHRSGLPIDRLVPAILSCKRRATAMQRGALLTRAVVARLYLVVLNIDTHRCWARDYYNNYAQFRWVGDSVHCASAIRSVACAVSLLFSTERSGVSLQDPQPIVGILIQPDTFGTRLLIAYERGLLVLWDVSEDRAVSVRGYGDLRMKGQINGAQGDSGEDQLNTTIDDSEEEREICSLCWASREGSTVAVGYITGDILLWDMTTKSSRQEKQSDVSSNVVKLQLASGSRRLLVIVLHWSAGSAVHSNKGGHLFVYGGDDMGSEEVLTVCLFFLLIITISFACHLKGCCAHAMSS